MILVMSAILVNKAVYIHVHVMPDGSVITHAHPFNKNADSDAGKSHHHSNLEFFMFQGLEILMLFAVLSAGLKKLSGEIKRRWFNLQLLSSGLIPIHQGRAPPCI